MMNNNVCKKFMLLIDEYIDGNLGGKELEEFEKHLSECADCRKELRSALALRDLIKQSEEDLPEGLHSKIMAAVAAETNKPVINKSKTKIWRSLAVSAACFMVCISLFAVFSSLPLFNNSGMGESIYDGAITAERDDESIPSTEDAAENIMTQAPALDGFPTETVAESAPPEGTTSSPDQSYAAPSTDIPATDAPAPSITQAPMMTEAPEMTEAPATAEPDLAPSVTKPPMSDYIAEDQKDNNYSSPNSRPGGEEITLALLIVSGLLAVASFIAFLISLSSVRKLPENKKDEEKK